MGYRPTPRQTLSPGPCGVAQGDQLPRSTASHCLPTIRASTGTVPSPQSLGHTCGASSGLGRPHAIPGPFWSSWETSGCFLTAPGHEKALLAAQSHLQASEQDPCTSGSLRWGAGAPWEHRAPRVGVLSPHSACRKLAARALLTPVGVSSTHAGEVAFLLQAGIFAFAFSHPCFFEGLLFLNSKARRGSPFSAFG